MEISIRNYKKADYLPIMMLDDDKWKEQLLSIGSSLMHSDDDTDVLIFLLAEIKDSIVGFVYGFKLPNRMLIPEFLYVKPEYRHQGIGKMLLKELEKQSGCNTSQIYYHKSLHDYYKNQGYLAGDNLEIAIKDISSVN